MTDTKSDTPRTDAEERLYGDHWCNELAVDSDFARELERENATLKSEVDRLKAEVERLKETCNTRADVYDKSKYIRVQLMSYKLDSKSSLCLTPCPYNNGVMISSATCQDCEYNVKNDTAMQTVVCAYPLPTTPEEE